ncbi:polyprenyl synthetase family protein [Paenibacillus roseipurpureus]|uniref:Farnesyl diphosphate synthase n=1 Tax=Paenibacillus roseopurpureus TaxID=2918901 RepID=A0AA96LK83_9BACL|nr:farnesyl diphosphate synthase [Paenibacillus sp. MBLB1832]WNR42548.1 polyprenyl synthetase family protein [Paenibacillus sp. MBLB1832]
MNNTSSNIHIYIAAHAEQVETALRQTLPAAWDVPSSLRESMDYSLMAGGKRLRPIMVLAAAEALGGSLEAAMPIAIAIELVHTYSLVHDDLPAMDNDDYRRGKLTNHKVYGEAMAILAGDALLTHAFYSITQAHKKHGAQADRVLAITEELAVLAGARGMVGGQAADMLGEQGLTKLEELTYIHTHKTSDLIVFSLRAGGHIAGATDEQLEALSKFGHALGLAFQIQDDILDIIGDEKKLGKPVKSDEKQMKVTFPYFIGMEASEQRVHELTQQAKDALNHSTIANPDRLLQIADYLMKRDH